MECKTAHIIEDKERTDDINIQENVTFDEMYLSDSVLAGLHASGFVRPSPIQLSAIPLGRCGLDLLVQAKSGTGKTCVFTVVALEMISVIAKATQVLVVAPTREIAVQITQVICHISSTMPDLKVSCFIGGINIIEDKANLLCHIAVGTPGRLIQLVTLGLLKLDNVRLLVLDEADQLLTGQFKDSIMCLVKTLPFNKQVLALSATFPDDVTEFLDKFMRAPSHVRLDKESLALIGVNQFVRILPDHPQPHKRHKIKLNELLNILSSVPFNQCLVFSNSQLRAESVCNQLASSGWPTSFLSGGQVQQDRLKAFHALCSFKCRVLVSTDLSARGLDSEHVNLVINLDIPTNQATYLHRVGRAGRFGSRGAAITLVCEGEEQESIRAISTLANVELQVLEKSWDLNIPLSELNTNETIIGLDEESCAIWVEKQDKNKFGYKTKTKNGNKVNDPSINLSQLSLKSNDKKLKAVYGSKDDNALNNLSDNNGISDGKSGKTESDISNTINPSGKINSDIDKLDNLKQVLQGFHKRHELIQFSNNDILNQCSNKWEHISEKDSPELKFENLLNGYPNDSQLGSLECYLKQLEETNASYVRRLENSTQNTSFDISTALQQVLLGKEPFDKVRLLNKKECDSTNYEAFTELANGYEPVNDHVRSCEAPAKSFSRCEVPTKSLANFEANENSVNSYDLSAELPNGELDLQLQSNYTKEESAIAFTNKNIDLVVLDPSCEFNRKLLPNGIDNTSNLELKCSTTELMNVNKNPKVASASVRPKDKAKSKYSENTGYGMWESVERPNKKIQKKNRAAKENKTTKLKDSSQVRKEKVTPSPYLNMNHCYKNLSYNEYKQAQKDEDIPKSRTKDHQRENPYYAYSNCDTYYSNLNSSIDFYIHSAKKFASMMNYVTTVGRMSAWIAKDYNERTRYGHNFVPKSSDIGDEQDH